MNLGKKVEPSPPPAKPEWELVPGKPHLRRHATTGRLRTYIPSNEAALTPAWEAFIRASQGKR